MTMFPPELRTAAFVPRWSIIRTIQSDTIASHSYFVAIYARMIAKMIGWKGPQDYLMFVALTHDTEETVTGDITGPAKKGIEVNDEYISDLMYSRMQSVVDMIDDDDDKYGEEIGDDISRIVKVADTLDAILYLVGEQRMGNTFVNFALDRGIPALEGQWRAMPADDKLLSRLWQTEVLPAITKHKTTGGMGV